MLCWVPRLIRGIFYSWFDIFLFVFIIPKHKKRQVMKIKKDDIVKVIRAIGVSAAVVAFCVWYRDSKIAEKQKQEDEAYVKDFSEFMLQSAEQEVDADKVDSALYKSYSVYKDEDLLRSLKTLKMDSAKIADELIRDSDIVLKWHDKTFEEILSTIKNTRKDFSSVVLKQKDSWNISNSDSKIAVNYQQYKEFIKLLRIIRFEINSRKK